MNHEMNVHGGFLEGAGAGRHAVKAVEAAVPPDSSRQHGRFVIGQNDSKDDDSSMSS
ncbi:hypothetical protein [Burkholderia perseverans]|uniref:hypothetical protein n=1 Tax=Burkholderia perseverans TaxID=2615214 RepID=UPI001FEEF7C7|nr:hypothetical protein [Burkholderia perseverans]